MKGICWRGLEPDRDHNFSRSSLTNANKTFRQQNANLVNITSFLHPARFPPTPLTWLTIVKYEGKERYLHTKEGNGTGIKTV